MNPLEHLTQKRANYETIISLIKTLESFINDDALMDIDPLIGLIHLPVLYMSRYIIRYVEALVADDLLVKQKIGRGNFYVNRKLFELLKSGWNA